MGAGITLGLIITSATCSLPWHISHYFPSALPVPALEPELWVAVAVINREVTWGPEPWFKFLLSSVGRSYQFKSSQGWWGDFWCCWIHLWGIPSPEDDWSVRVGFYRHQPVFSGEAELLKQTSHQYFDDFQLLSFSYTVVCGNLREYYSWGLLN